MTKAELHEFRILALEKQIEILWKEVSKVKAENIKLQIAAAKSSLITGLVHSSGTIMFIYLSRKALFGG